MNNDLHPAISAPLFWGAAQDSFDHRDPSDYGTGYRALRDMFQSYVRPADYLSVVAGATAVYGWMPTILSGVDQRQWAECKDTLQGLKEATTWGEARALLVDRPDVLKLVNRSVVGTSKFLHFLNPAIFPIWDSHIAFGFRCRTAAKINSSESYIAYGDAVWAAITQAA